MYLKFIKPKGDSSKDKMCNCKLILKRKQAVGVLFANSFHLPDANIKTFKGGYPKNYRGLRDCKNKKFHSALNLPLVLNVIDKIRT